MKCPVCPDATLVMTDRQGVEIDYCPQCRGVWLDRGELDKIIERSAGPAAAAAQPRGRPEPEREREPERRDSAYGQKPKKRGSLLEELFDF